MTSGWRCSRDRWQWIAIGLAGLATAAWVGHELRTERVCEFAPELRPAIVDTMRRVHGAGAVIDEREAAIIATFLGDPALCTDVKTGQPDGPTERPSR